MTICEGAEKCQVVNQALHSATRQGGGPHGEYKMCIRGTSTKVERIRPEIDPASRLVNCSRSVWTGNTFTHYEGNAREMNRKTQKETPATGRFLVTKTTVKLPAATWASAQTEEDGDVNNCSREQVCLPLLIHCKQIGNRLFRNVGHCLQNHTASHSRQLISLSSLPETQFSHL
jgi:hypothetical protein